MVNGFSTKVLKPFSGERTVFQHQCWNNKIATGKIIKLDPYLISYTKTKVKWIKDLHVRGKTITLRQKHRNKSSSPWIWQWILTFDTKCQSNKRKNR